MAFEQSMSGNGARNRQSWYRRPWLVLIAITCIAAAVFGIFLFADAYSTVSLQFQLRDAVSGSWVWGATVALQGYVNRGYYQIDYEFTHLKPGPAVLEVNASSYLSQKIPLTLSRGNNGIAAPIGLVGYEIPNLKDFILFEQSRGASEFEVELRPRDIDGQAILNHPALDLMIVGVISAQMQGGELTRVPRESGSTRGEELYRGVLSVSWNSLPETLFRYRASVPLEEVAWSPAKYWVIDYVILAPDPRKIGKDELEDLVHRVLVARDPGPILDLYHGRVRSFLTTSWNVEAGG
jgi:hypothetical protein